MHTYIYIYTHLTVTYYIISSYTWQTFIDFRAHPQSESSPEIHFIRSHSWTSSAIIRPDCGLWHLWIGISWPASWLGPLSRRADLFRHHEFHHQAFCVDDAGRHQVQRVSRSVADHARQHADIIQKSSELWRWNTALGWLTKSGQLLFE